MTRIEDALEVLDALNSQGRIEYAVYSELHDTISMIDAEPKSGHWVHLDGDEWCCDKCGFVISTEGSWQHPKAKEAGNDYCKHCGAKMDEVEYE